MGYRILRGAAAASLLLFFANIFGGPTLLTTHAAASPGSGANAPAPARPDFEGLLAEAEALAARDTWPAYREAIRKFEESLALLRASGGGPAREAYVLSRLGAAHVEIYQHEKGLEHLGRALEMARAAGDRALEAYALTCIGRAYYEQGEGDRALEVLNRALPLWRALGDRAGEAETHAYVGGVRTRWREGAAALESVNRALALWREVGNKEEEALALDNLGAILVDMGEAQKALDHFNHALEMLPQIENPRVRANVYNDLYAIYWSLGDNKKALEYLETALPLWREAGHLVGEAATLNNMGSVYSELKEQEKSLDMYLRSLPLRREAGDRVGEAVSLSNLGRKYADVKQYDKALECLDRALVLRREVGDRTGESAVLNHIGVVHEGKGDRQRALELFRQALVISRAVGNNRFTFGAYTNVAKNEWALGNLQEARRAYEGALSIVESTRGQVLNTQLRGSYLAMVHVAFDRYVELLMEMHAKFPGEGYDALAIQARERARSRTLLDLLNEASVDIRRGVDAKVLAREESLRAEIAAKAGQQTRLLASAKTPAADAARAEREVGRLLEEYERVQESIRRTSPRYASLARPALLSLKEMQSLLDADTVLLSYALTSRKSFLWAVTHDSISSHELPKGAEVEAAARRFHQLLTARNESKPGETGEQRAARVAAADAELQEAGLGLSRMVVGPVAARLGSKRLVVVSEGALQYVPFSALPDPSAEGAAKGEPLVVRHEVVSLPSASTLAYLRREYAGRRPAPRQLAVIADPVFSVTDPRVKASARAGTKAAGGDELASAAAATRAFEEVASARGGIPRLPFSRREAEAIYAAVPAGVGLKALDFTANKRTATGPELARHRVIHFATHGLLNSTHPELSGVVLSLVDEAGRPQDGFLRLNEIYNLSLPADLVVLSACQTGLGKEVRGEGLVGLTRGFMYAGSPRVVASLWKVDDAGTSELMRRFYQGMFKGGLTPSAALRAAKAEMMAEERWRSPYFWAAFEIQGEWR